MRWTVYSATKRSLPITAVAFLTSLNRLTSSVRSRAAANGDSIGLVVRRCCQCGCGNRKKATSRPEGQGSLLLMQ